MFKIFLKKLLVWSNYITKNVLKDKIIYKDTDLVHTGFNFLFLGTISQVRL